jgi:hypothetical protein
VDKSLEICLSTVADDMLGACDLDPGNVVERLKERADSKGAYKKFEARLALLGYAMMAYFLEEGGRQWPDDGPETKEPEGSESSPPSCSDSSESMPTAADSTTEAPAAQT